MLQHLVITVMGSDRPGISNHIIHLVSQSNCNILDSRIALYGDEFTLVMLVTGSIPEITQVENQLPLLGQEHELITMMKRTKPHTITSNCYHLEVFVETADRVGITEQFTQFFADKKIGLESLSARTIDKGVTDTKQDQFHLSFTASVSDSFNLMQLQEEFDNLCQQLSVDGSLNFLKTRH
jgi:glycine cleavage system transcriptional repressor